MRTSMTAQQTSFFTINGYIELEGISFDPEEVFSAARTASSLQPFGRDLWRKEELLQRLLLRKIAPAVSHLMAKPVRLACDQWMPSYLPEKACPVKDLFCIQGLILCALFTPVEIPAPVRRLAALGIPPFPSKPGNILFVKPNIVLDWPILAKSPAEIYLAAYALPNNGVYVHNAKDPAAHLLKELGYDFGDKLVETHHPLLMHYG